MAGDTNVVLKLLMDVAGAKKEASSVVAAVDEAKKGVEQFGQQMDNTLRGRVLKGVVGAIESNMSNLFNEQIPQAIASAELQIAALGATFEKAFGATAGKAAAGLARQSLSPEVLAQQQTFNTIQQLSQAAPGVTFDEADLKIMVAELNKQNAANMEAARQNLRRAQGAMGTPSQYFDPDLLTERLGGAIGKLKDAATGELGAPIGAALGVAAIKGVFDAVTPG